jgi:hypothetical protein
MALFPALGESVQKKCDQILSMSSAPPLLGTVCTAVILACASMQLVHVLARTSEIAMKIYMMCNTQHVVELLLLTCASVHLY